MKKYTVGNAILLIVLAAGLTMACNGAGAPGTGTVAASPGVASASGAPAGQAGQAGQARTGGQAGNGGPGGAPGQGQGRGRNSVISVQVTVAQYDSLQADHQTAGTVQAVTTSNVSAQTSGVVAKLLHRVGEWVAEGETIVKLDDTALSLTARNAQIGRAHV